MNETQVTRVFDAPRELVWKALTEPEHFAQWFGTPPFTTPVSTITMDVRPGGASRGSTTVSRHIWRSSRRRRAPRMVVMEGAPLTATPAAGELEEHRHALTAYCYRMLGSPFEAEDAVQDTFLRAWRNLDRFEG